MDTKERTRENRLRRQLDRMGYRLVRSGRKDPAALDYDRCKVIDERTGAVVLGEGEFRGLASATLDDVEQWIERRVDAAQSNAGRRSDADES